MTKCVVTATWDDVPHLTEQQKADLRDSYPAHERDARTKGIPILGSGRVFDIPEEALYEGFIEIPSHWPRLVAVDFGIAHPFAAIWMAWDRDRDTIHIYDALRVSDQSVNQHVPAIRSKGEWIPVAWPHDGLQRDKGSGVQLAAQYRAAGLNMLPDHATFENGSNGTEAGISEMKNRMETNRFKVGKHLHEWFEEYRLYHREKGLIIKLRDDLLSASRIGVMSLRHATIKPTSKPLKYQKMGNI